MRMDSVGVLHAAHGVDLGNKDRPAIPKASIVFGGCPEGVQLLFRGWDNEHGLWGLGGLMAGSSMSKGQVGDQVKKASVEELVRVVCR